MDTQVLTGGRNINSAACSALIADLASDKYCSLRLLNFRNREDEQSRDFTASGITETGIGIASLGKYGLAHSLSAIHELESRPQTHKHFGLITELVVSSNRQDKMTTRPTVTIHGADGAATDDSHTLPIVFKAPIRPDIVQYEPTHS